MVYAKNSDSARNLFIRRNRFKRTDGFAIKNTYAHEGILIGKINLDDSPIVPKKQKLVSLDSASVIDGLNIYALDFVRLAFDSMVLRFKDGAQSGKVFVPEQQQSPLDTFRGHSAYSDPEQGYKNYISFFVENYMISLNSAVRNKKVDTFEKYVHEFFKTARYMINSYPLLYSDYIVSNKNTQLSSGLIVEIDDHVCDDDTYKTGFFYNHPNFTYINNLAVSFGFRIDKNIPWRFIADINSPQMRYYMRVCDATFENYYLANTNEVLGRYYVSPVLDDYGFLIRILYTGYTQFLQKYPYIKKYDQSPCAKTNDGRLVIRNPESNIDKTLIKYIFGEFVYFKNLFHDFNLTEQEINLMKNKVNYIIDNSNIYAANIYLNKVFNNNNNMFGSINHTVTNLSLIESGENQNASELLRMQIKRDRINRSAI